MRYWWVNQNQTYRQEIDGGYLWSPKRKANQQRNPFYEFMRDGGKGGFHSIRKPETLATAIKIGDPISWPKALLEITTTNGVVEFATEQEIADAKAQIGAAGIGCEPASAATLAGIKKMISAGIMRRDANVVAILTGNVLKDPDYIYNYHTSQLDDPHGSRLRSTYANAPVVVPNDADQIAALLG